MTSEPTVTCPYCDTPVADGANFCGGCGSDLTPIWKAREDVYVGTVVANRYRVREKVGSGGMGEVYLAEHEQLGQKVAIKFLSRRLIRDEKVVRRFFNEARSTCKVTHHGAVSFNDFGQTDDGVLYIIMEYVDGTPLNALVEQRGRLELTTALHIILQLCDTLHAAHQQGVIHRDLKPDNIMLVAGRGGRYSTKILDFGIARLIDDGEVSRLTDAGMVFGTPEFMSPEQCLGREVDGRSDQYALAIVLYYMLSGGYLPIQGTNRMELINRQVTEPPVPLYERIPEGTVPLEVDRILARALEKQPDRRYASVHEFAEALEQLAAEATHSGLIPAQGSPLVGVMPATPERGAPARASAPVESASPPADTVASPVPRPRVDSAPYELGNLPGMPQDERDSWAPGGLGRAGVRPAPTFAPGSIGPPPPSDGLGIDLSAEGTSGYRPQRRSNPMPFIVGAVVVLLGVVGWLGYALLSGAPGDAGEVSADAAAEPAEALAPDVAADAVESDEPDAEVEEAADVAPPPEAVEEPRTAPTRRAAPARRAVPVRRATAPTRRGAPSVKDKLNQELEEMKAGTAAPKPPADKKPDAGGLPPRQLE